MWQKQERKRWQNSKHDTYFKVPGTVALIKNAARLNEKQVSTQPLLKRTRRPAHTVDMTFL